MGQKKVVCLCLFFMTLYVSACSPYSAIRGNFPEEEAVSSIQTGVSTKAEVIEILGSPTNIDPFDPNHWYYIGEKTEMFSFMSPDVTEKKVFEVIFSENDKVLSIQELKADHDFSIKPKGRKTKTLGKDPSFLQELLGNFGKFSRQEKAK